MKNLIPIVLLSLLPTFLDAQMTSFVKQFSGHTDKEVTEMIELPNKDLLVINKESTSPSGSKIQSKLYVLKENGALKDSIIFVDSLKSLTVLKIIPTSYGYCLLGEMRENNLAYFWNAKLDAQFKILSQQYTPTNAFNLTVSFIITKDSSIAVVASLIFGSYLSYNVAKISKNGVLSSFNNSLTYAYGSFPVSIFERKDSVGFLILDEFKWTVTDSVFNLRYTQVINFYTNGLYASPNLQPTGIRKNDSTYYYAGRWLNFRGRRNRDLVFLTLNTLGQVKYYRTIEAGLDTNYIQGITKCIDTTRDGNYIFWGGSYNFNYSQIAYSLNQAPFILTKLDTAYRIVWQKKYGEGAYHLMMGLLATSDGGCAIYGRRYDYNNVPKTDAYIIKVDGNGVVTSTTSIPLSQSNIIAYPNPSNGQLRFKKEDPSVSSTFEVNIFDISGKLVFQKKETDLSETFDLNHLATGDYIYQIKQKEQIISIGKWVKVK
jgi:Secretion system C-terminal sorting domain